MSPNLILFEASKDSTTLSTTSSLRLRSMREQFLTFSTFSRGLNASTHGDDDAGEEDEDDEEEQ